MDIMKKSSNSSIANLSKTFYNLFDKYYENDITDYIDFCNKMGRIGNFIRGDKNLNSLDRSNDGEIFFLQKNEINDIDFKTENKYYNNY